MRPQSRIEPWFSLLPHLSCIVSCNNRVSIVHSTKLFISYLDVRSVCLRYSAPERHHFLGAEGPQRMAETGRCPPLLHPLYLQTQMSWIYSKCYICVLNVCFIFRERLHSARSLDLKFVVGKPQARMAQSWPSSQELRKSVISYPDTYCEICFL